ncbi:MAG: hypothetical protein Fues2KO_20370 [Fuerstiella sp.]
MKFAGATNQLIRCVGLMTVVMSISSSACAHPISISECRLQIEQSRATANITIYLEDLYLFHDLRPTLANYLTPAEIERGIELHQLFVAERFHLEDSSGQRIRPEADPTVSHNLPAGGVALPELMAYQVTFELRFALPDDPPVVTVGHSFSGPNDVFPAEMKLIATSSATGNEVRRTIPSGGSQTLELTWPSNSDSFNTTTSPTITAANSSATESFGAVYSFLYIEDYEVRHEILMPLPVLAESLPLNHRHPSTLSVSEQRQLLPAIDALLMPHIDLQINRVAARPRQTRCRFVGTDWQQLLTEIEAQPVSVVDGRIAIVLSYPATEPVQAVQLTWNLFSESIFGIQQIVLHDDDMQRNVLTYLAGRNRFEWIDTRPAPSIRIEPLVSPKPASGSSILVWWLIVAGVAASALFLAATMQTRRTQRNTLLTAGLLVTFVTAWQSFEPGPTSDESFTGSQQQLRQSLLRNLYAAFEFRDEQQIYDALSISCDVGLTRRIYLQLAESLRHADQGNAIAAIRSVTFPELTADATSTDSECSWVVSGTVEHWGHVHERSNRFRARLDVDWIEDSWKLTDLQITDQQQLSASSFARKPRSISP